MEWFRFYSETIRDSKIRRVARKTGETPAHVIGVWSILLSIASESQQRGVLLLGNDPVTVEDIEDVTGCNVSATLREMVQVGMLDFDGEVYSIAAWDKRQYASDNSTPRVQKYRQSKKQAETLPETLPKRYGNAPESESDADTEKREVAPAAAAIDLLQNGEDPEWHAALAKLDAKWLNSVSGSVQLKLARVWPQMSNGRKAWLDDAIAEAVARGARTPDYAITVLANALRDNKRPGEVTQPAKRGSAKTTSAELDAIFGVDIHGNPV